MFENLYDKPKPRKYNHILVRKEYPQEGGYRMEPESLPDYLHIEIHQDGDDKHLEVHSRIHVTKVGRVGPVYSSKFTDGEIIKDLTGEIAHRYL